MFSENSFQINLNFTPQVIKMLLVVVLLYAFCWAPVTIESLLTSLGYLHKMHFGVIKHLRQVIVMLSYVNSCVNPVVYAFMSKNFKSSFYSMISCRRQACCKSCFRGNRCEGQTDAAETFEKNSFWKKKTQSSRVV